VERKAGLLAPIGNAGIDRMSKTAGARQSDSVPTAATPAVSSRFKGSGAPSSRRAPLALVAGLALLVSLAFGAGVASAASGENPPAITVAPATEVEYTTAHLSGTIDDNGELETTYVFQYSSDGGTTWESSGGARLSAGSGPQAVSLDLKGLQPSTDYIFRLAAENYGSAYTRVYSGETPAFTTKTATPPSATIDPADPLSGTTANFTGTVDTHAPAGPLSDAAKDAYKTAWHFECTPECHGHIEGFVSAEEGSANVSVEALRLEANTFYEVKLVASNAAGSVSTTPGTFQMPLVAPAVKSTPGASDGKGGYTVEGIVTPFNSKITDCHFEYGPTTAYVFVAPCSPIPTGRNEVQKLHMFGRSGHFNLSFQGQTTADLPYNATAPEVETALQALSTIGPDGVSVNVSYEEFFGDFYATFTINFDGGIVESASVAEIQLHDSTLAGSEPYSGNGIEVVVQGGNNLPVVVEAHLTGLTPDATYHFQLVATNSVDTVSSGDRQFRPTVDPPQPPCPNDAVRAENSSLELPECRAYEMVSSPEKGSNPAGLYLYNEGTSAIYSARAGNIAGSGQGSTGNNNYLSKRTGSGWETVPNLNGPSGSLFGPPYEILSASVPTVYSRDLESSLWYNEPGAKSFTANRVHLRNPDGSFSLVGNNGINGGGLHLGNGSSELLVGQSDDLSHLVFNGGSAFGFVWGPGVYEFIGRDNDQPDRVDVDDSGTLLSTCNNRGYNEMNSLGNAVSTDGSRIVFTVRGHCPLPHAADAPLADQLWVRVDGSDSYQASASHCTRTSGSPDGACNGPADAHFQAASRDGTRVYFTTTQQLVDGDTDQTNDLYLYDLPTSSTPGGTLTEVSGAASEAKVERVAVVSDDGSTVYFLSPAVLADNPDMYGNTPVESEHNLYVWHRDGDNPAGQTKFVGALLSDDLKAQTTSEGRYLVFTTDTPLVETDTDNRADAYRYDVESEQTIRLSTGLKGIGGNADNFPVSIGVLTGAAYGQMQRLHSHNAVTDDGAAIVFSTEEALSPVVDGNGVSDVYMWRDGKVSLITTGAVGAGGREAAIDADGQDIYFTSPGALSPADPDNVDDVYDARVGGGFSFAPENRCSGETCQPPASPSPSDPAPKSDGAGSAGNVKPGSASLRSPSSSARAKLASGGKAGLKLRVSEPGRVTVTGTAKVGGKRKQVFAATVTAKKAGEVVVPVSLSKPAQAQLRKTGSLTVDVSVTLAGGLSQASKLKLTAPKPKSPHAKKRGG
jgi:hypothetical protein